MGDKLKFAIYWSASCAGCDMAILDLNEKILDVAAAADIYFWPVAMDFKLKDVEALEDGFLDVCFFHGAVRNSEQLHIARLLRRKSKVMVAFGSCACFGGIPGLANFFTAPEILERIYQDTPSTDNSEMTRPQTSTTVPEGELTLPEFYNTVFTLADAVPVEYYLPGCPPTVDLIAGALEAIVKGELPPPGAVLAPEKTCCDTCPRDKKDKTIKEFKRPYQVIVDPEKCLLEQGIVCCGPATRGGCGNRCMAVNMPCRGCFGPPAKISDHGAALAGAIAAMVDSNDEAEINRILGQLADPAGTFYRFSLPVSLLKARVVKEGSL